MRKLTRVICSVFALTLPLGASQPTVRVEPAHVQGPRDLSDQTREAVVRGYLEAWQSMATAL